MMNPFRFGPADRQLHGIFHKAEVRRIPGTAVLLCNPFGQEAVRLHRLYRVLAERLARSGVSVLRFDYFATGDSAGDDEAGSLAEWRENLIEAHRELVQRSRSQHVLWIGARLGATLVAQASGQLEEPVKKLVLWEPVVNGPAYLQELGLAHAKAQDNALLPPVAPQGEPGDEAIGFGMGAQLIADLRALSPDVFSSARADRICLIANPDQPDTVLQARLEPTGAPVDKVSLKLAFDWTSEEALNTALVPQEALQLLAGIVEGTSA